MPLTADGPPEAFETVACGPRDEEGAAIVATETGFALATTGTTPRWLEKGCSGGEDKGVYFAPLDEHALAFEKSPQRLESKNEFTYFLEAGRGSVLWLVPNAYFRTGTLATILPGTTLGMQRAVDDHFEDGAAVGTDSVTVAYPPVSTKAILASPDARWISRSDDAGKVKCVQRFTDVGQIADTRGDGLLFYGVDHGAAVFRRGTMPESCP